MWGVIYFCVPEQSTHFGLRKYFGGQILEENIRKVKLSTPDYRGMADDEAYEDFKQRRGK